MKTLGTVLLLAALAFPAGCGGESEEGGKTDKADKAAKAGSRERARKQKQPAAGAAGYFDVLMDARRRAKEMSRDLPARQTVEAFHALKGRFPRDLAELKKEFPAFPDPPQGMKYSYEPSTGKIEVVPEK